MRHLELAFLFFVNGAVLIGAAAWLRKWQATPDAPDFWKKWSTWLAGLNAAAWAYVTATSGSLLGFVFWIPRAYQVPAVIAIFIIGWVLPVITAHIKQSNIQGKTDA